MQVVTTVSFKGGVGKTTALMALACAAAARGERVLLIDSDQNLPMTEWQVTGQKNDYWSDLVRVEEHMNFDTLHKSVLTHDDAGDVDLVLIDSKGGRSDFHNALVQIVDIVLVPTRPLKVDADQVVTTLQWMRKLESEGIDTAPAYILFAAIKSASQLSPDMVFMRDTLMRAPHLTAQLPERVTFNNMQARGLLSEITATLAADADPLARGQARPYRNALAEATAVLDEVRAKIQTAELAETGS